MTRELINKIINNLDDNNVQVAETSIVLIMFLKNKGVDLSVAEQTEISNITMGKMMSMFSVKDLEDYLLEQVED